MPTLMLSEAEVIVLRTILQSYAQELEPLAGQDMTVDLDDAGEAEVVARAADEFNRHDPEFELVEEDGTFNLITMVDYFVDRLDFKPAKLAKKMKKKR
jgi:hypothetical protein